MGSRLDRAREPHRRRAAPALLAGLVLAGLVCSGGAGHVTATAANQGPGDADDPLLRWPLPPGAERYGAIDGRRMHRDVVAQAEISCRAMPATWLLLPVDSIARDGAHQGAV